MAEGHQAHEAALAGSMTALRSALDNQDAKQAAQHGATPLHFAAACISTDPRPVIALLLESGAHPSAATPAGVTPLHIAACLGNARFVSALLDLTRSAEDLDLDLDAPLSDTAFTPLHLACAASSEAVTEQLLHAGAQRAALSTRGLLPLHVAANLAAHAPLAALLRSSSSSSNGASTSASANANASASSSASAGANASAGASAGAGDSASAGAGATASASAGASAATALLKRDGASALHLLAGPRDAEVARAAACVCACVDWLADVRVGPALLATLRAAHAHGDLPDDQFRSGSVMRTVRQLAEVPVPLLRAVTHPATPPLKQVSMEKPAKASKTTFLKVRATLRFC